MMRLPAPATLLLALLAIVLAPRPAAAGPLDSLDSYCGGAISSPGCVATVTTYPIEVGAMITLMEAKKDQIGGAEQCRNMFGAGAALYSQIQPYLTDAGADVGQMVKCSCNIVYSTTTCSGAVQQATKQVTDAVGYVLSKLDSILGLDVPVDGETHEQGLARYWATVYAPMEKPLIPVSDELVHDTENQLEHKCYEDWGVTPYDEKQICHDYWVRFDQEVGQYRSVYLAVQASLAAAAKAKLELEKEKLQAEKDAATTNARLIGLSWARIKHDIYVKQCHDKTCVDGVTFLAFAYYGQIATGMQKLDSSNTQVLVAANNQFEPLFKEQIASDHARWIARLSTAGLEVGNLLKPRLQRAEQVHQLRMELKTRLMLLGVHDSDAVLKRAIRLRARHAYVPALASGIRVRPIQSRIPLRPIQ